MFDHYLFRSAYSASKNTIGSWLKLFWGQNYTWPPSLHLIPPRPCPDKCSNSRFFSLLLFLSLFLFPIFSFLLTSFLLYHSLCLFSLNMSLFCLLLTVFLVPLCFRLSFLVLNKPPTLFPFLCLSLIEYFLYHSFFIFLFLCLLLFFCFFFLLVSLVAPFE